MNREIFAQLSRKRDSAVGAPVGPMSEYLEEADFYLTKSRSEWPCGILITDGTHNVDHPGCMTTDWRE